MVFSSVAAIGLYRRLVVEENSCCLVALNDSLTTSGGAPETQGLLTDPHLGQLAGQQYSGMGGYGGYGNDHGAYHGNYG